MRLYTDLLQALKGERLSSVFSPHGNLISASAAPHCGDADNVFADRAKLQAVSMTYPLDHRLSRAQRVKTTLPASTQSSGTCPKHLVMPGTLFSVSDRGDLTASLRHTAYLFNWQPAHKYFYACIVSERGFSEY